MEIVCVTEALACAQLASVEALSGWQLVSATLEPLTGGLTACARRLDLADDRLVQSARDGAGAAPAGR